MDFERLGSDRHLFLIEDGDSGVAILSDAERARAYQAANSSSCCGLGVAGAIGGGRAGRPTRRERERTLVHVGTLARTLACAVIKRIAVKDERPVGPDRLRVAEQESQGVDGVGMMLHQVSQPEAEGVLRLADVSANDGLLEALVAVVMTSLRSEVERHVVLIDCVGDPVGLVKGRAERLLCEDAFGLAPRSAASTITSVL